MDLERNKPFCKQPHKPSCKQSCKQPCKLGSTHFLNYCGKQFKLYKVKKNGELIIFTPFDRLWELVAFTGNFHNWFFCGLQQEFALPSTSTTQLTGRKFPGSDFIVFTRSNTDGPITSDGIRLTTFSNSTNLRIFWKINRGVARDPNNSYRCKQDNSCRCKQDNSCRCKQNNSSRCKQNNSDGNQNQPNVPCINIGFYTTDVIQPQDDDRMYAMYTRDDIAIFEANQCNEFSGEFVSPTLNQLFVNVPTDADVRVDLTVVIDIPNVVIPCLEPNRAFIKYLHVECKDKILKIPVYSLVLSDVSTQTVTKTVFPWFQRLTDQIHLVYNRTSLSLLLPIEPGPTPPPVTYNDVPLSFTEIDSSQFRVGTVTDSFGPSVYIDWWFGDHWAFRLFSTQQMVPLITFTLEITIPSNPSGVAIFIPIVYLMYMTAGSLWKIHTELDQLTGTKIGPAIRPLPEISSGQTITYLPVSILLATDSTDVNLTISLNQATLFEIPNIPIIRVVSFNITYVPNPAIPPAPLIKQ